MMKNFLLFFFQSLIRTAEQLKIKGLCEINDHTSPESDTEVVYPPHKKSRASRHFESSNNAIGAQDDKRKSKSPHKDASKSNFSSNGNQNSSKAMASLEMGMVG
jgi:hypothetical protein